MLATVAYFLGFAAGQAPPAVHEKAEQGDAKAQYNLGGMHENGEGVLQDNAEAGKWRATG